MTTVTSVPASAITDLQLPEQEKLTTGGVSRFVRLAITLVGLALAGGGYIAYLRNPPWLQAVRGTEYDTATVTARGKDEVALELSGYVVPYRKVNISPRIPGMITELPIDVGQRVKKGDLLAQLDDDSYQADLKQAQAQLKVAQSAYLEAKNGAQPEELEQARISLKAAKKKLEFITADVERNKKLTDSTSQSELDQLLSAQNDAQANVNRLEQQLQLLENGARTETLSRLEGSVQQAQALVDKAQYYVDNTRMISPLDATVLEKNAEVGEILRPEGLTTSLCVLADLSVMEVEVDVQERDLHKIQLGRASKIIPDAYSDHEYLGKIDRFQPQVNRQRGVVRVTIRIDEPDKYLIPEMNVRALIMNPPSDTPVEETLWVADAAVTQKDGQAWVFVLDGDHAAKRTVTVGEKDGKRIQLLTGVHKDDVLVLAGDKRLVDGQVVRRKKSAK